MEHMKKSNIVDYRAFRFPKLNTPEFGHLKYLAYWPVFGLLFLVVERLWVRRRIIQYPARWMMQSHFVSIFWCRICFGLFF